MSVDNDHGIGCGCWECRRIMEGAIDRNAEIETVADRVLTPRKVPARKNKTQTK